MWPGCDRQLPAVAWFHTLATPPPAPHLPLQTAAWETTGHQAGASLCSLEQGSRPNQYLCISCPFAQVSSLIITAWQSLNAFAGWAKGRGWVTFPRPWVDWDHIHRHEDRHNKATQMTLLLIHAGSSSVASVMPNSILKNKHFFFAAALISSGADQVEHDFETFLQPVWCRFSTWQTPTTSSSYDFSICAVQRQARKELFLKEIFEK